MMKVLAWLGFGAGDGGGGPHPHRHAAHGRGHDGIDPLIATTGEGMRAIAWSFLLLLLTAALQTVVVVASGSVALLADTIHNVSDAGTAIPLWVAFMLARRRPSDRFTYGYGRVEDLAGLAIVVIILASAIATVYEAVDRLIHPQAVAELRWVAFAGLVGFLGNEVVAVVRIRAGRRIASVALIADGYHARTDGLTSLAVVAGAAGVWLGFPLADPLIGLVIAAAILVIVWQSGRAVFTRLLDGVEPGTVDAIQHAAAHVAGVRRVTQARARWSGHRLYVDVAISVDESLPLAAARRIAETLERELAARLPALAAANVRFCASALSH